RARSCRNHRGSAAAPVARKPPRLPPVCWTAAADHIAGAPPAHAVALLFPFMAGLVPAIHLFCLGGRSLQDVGAQNKSGQEDAEKSARRGLCRIAFGAGSVARSG